jgi:hypothetical protein
MPSRDGIDVPRSARTGTTHHMISDRVTGYETT